MCMIVFLMCLKRLLCLLLNRLCSVCLSVVCVLVDELVVGVVMVGGYGGVMCRLVFCSVLW